jgi:hypothetical protein
LEQRNRCFVVQWRSFHENRGVGFELHGEMMMLTMFGGTKKFLKIGCREKKVNGFEEFGVRGSEVRV